MISAKLVVEQLINGLVLGCMYAAVASGLTLIWGTMKMLNFAHGEFYMLGGYVLYFALTLFGFSPFICVIITIIAIFVLGIILEKLIVHPLLDKPGWELSPMLVTIGISIFLQNLALKLWGERFKNVPYFLKGTASFFGIHIAYQRIIIIVEAPSI